MKSIVQGGLVAAALAASTATQAADVRLPVKAPPPVATVYSWTGCYIGGQLGLQRADVTGDVNYPADPIRGTPGFSASRDFDSSGALIYGGQIGCNFQPGFAGGLILGVEGDLVGRSHGDEGGEIFRFGAPFATDHFDGNGRFGTQASLRLRAGIAFDRMLVYVAGGWSWAKLDGTRYFIRDGVGTLSVDSDKTVDGWNLGIGAEFALVSNWRMGLEYRYTDYGSFTRAVPGGAIGPFAWQPFTVSADNLRTQDIRLRFNYAFGAEVVSARY